MKNNGTPEIHVPERDRDCTIAIRDLTNVATQRSKKMKLFQRSGGNIPSKRMADICQRFIPEWMIELIGA